MSKTNSQSSPQPSVEEVVEISVGQNHTRILPSELEQHRRSIFSSLQRDELSHFLRTDESDVLDTSVASERFDGVGKTSDDLHEVGRVSAGDEDRSYGVDEVMG